MSKCEGCGIDLQNEFPNELGYTPLLTNKYCMRCFKLTNYGDKSPSNLNLTNEEIITKINNSNALVVFTCDFWTLSQNVVNLYHQIKQSKIFLLTKIDLIPKNINLDILKNKIKKIYDLEDVLMISIKNNDGEKELIDVIKNQSKVLFAGPTSSGKSSLINHLYGKELTVSSSLNTTQDLVVMDMNNQKIIDAPGFYFPFWQELKKQAGYTKSKSLHLNKEYCLENSNYEMHCDQDINITLFLPKQLLFKTKKIKKRYDKVINIPAKTDVIISNIAIIYFKNSCKLYLNNIDHIEIRESIVGK